MDHSLRGGNWLEGASMARERLNGVLNFDVRACRTAKSAAAWSMRESR